METNASAQTEIFQSQCEIVPLYERKIVRIKDEFQSTIDTIEGALKLATMNYEQKCSEVEELNGQLNMERTENKALKLQLEHLDATINDKNELITNLKLEIHILNKNKLLNLNLSNSSESEDQLRKELALVKGMLTDMLAYEKYILDIAEQEKKVVTLSDALIEYKTESDAKKPSEIFNESQDKNDRLKVEIEVFKHKLNAHISKPIRTTLSEIEFKKMARIEKESRNSTPIASNVMKKTIKLHNWTKLMKTEFESSALVLQKFADRLQGKRESLSLEHPNQGHSNKDSVTQQDLLKCQSDKIKVLKSQINHEKERAEKIFAHKRNKFEKELNKEKACREKVKSKLECIIRKNRAVIDELNCAREKAITNDAENTQVCMTHLKELGTKLKNLDKDSDILRDRVSFLQADIGREKQRKSETTNSLIPQQFLTKVKEMNSNLSEIVYKNRQLTETVENLVAERQVLQTKIKDMENFCKDRNYAANQLLQNYQRTENFRRALIHQKHYLMIMLNSYRKVETRLSVAVGNSKSENQRRIPSFKSVALTAIAIIRMKTAIQRSESSN